MSAINEVTTEKLKLFQDFCLYFPKYKDSILKCFMFIFAIAQPKFGILYFYRKHKICKLLNRKYSFIYYLMNHYFNNSEINNEACLGVGVNIPHPIGVVIGGDSVIGEGSVVMSNVTLGANSAKKGDYYYPKLGTNCYIGSNTTLIGDIELGDNVTIGANSFVNKSFPNNSVIAGVPAIRIK